MLVYVGIVAAGLAMWGLASVTWKWFDKIRERKERELSEQGEPEQSPGSLWEAAYEEGFRRDRDEER